MSNRDKIRGIVDVFERVSDELGIKEDRTDKCKERIAKMLDKLVGTSWRYEVNIHAPMGSDPFGGGWMPEIDLSDKPDAYDLDEMYRRMRLLARDRGMAEERLEHMPSDMDHKAYEAIPEPTSKTLKVIVYRPCKAKK